MTVPNRRRTTKAFTLIELLACVLILAMLMAVALPLYLGAVAKSERTTCRTNMSTIAHAEQAFRARNFPTYVYTTDLTKLSGDLGATPTCPEQGSYTVAVSDGSQLANNGMPVPAGGLIVKCSVGAHGVYAPSIDAE